MVRICKVARTLDLYKDSYADVDVQIFPGQSAEHSEEECYNNEENYNYDTQVNEKLKGPATFRGRTSSTFTKRRTMKCKFAPEKPCNRASAYSAVISPCNASDLSSSRYPVYTVCIIVFLLMFRLLLI